MSEYAIFYGAGEWARAHANKQQPYEPLCFCDADRAKQGSRLHGVPVTSLDEALRAHPEARLLITLDPYTAFPFAQEYLLTEKGMAKERIINYRVFKKGVFCHSLIESLHFGFDKGAIYCCQGWNSNTPPVVRFGSSAKETAERIVAYRDELMDALNKGDENPCSNCSMLKNGYYPAKKTLNNIDFGCGDGYDFCNLQCAYCSIRLWQDKSAKKYDARLGLPLETRLEIAKELGGGMGAVDESTRVQISCGEPAIHPKLGLMLDAFPDNHFQFLSNGTVYGERFAEKLRSGKGTMEISVDAGTKETYAKLKGADLYDRLLHNCRNYAEAGDVRLKYIFYNEMNNGARDAEGFADFCGKVRPKSVNLVNAWFDCEKPLSEATQRALRIMEDGLCEAGIVCAVDRSLRRPEVIV
jgi:uncharacterized Fe-S cluster-containing radical SAM superfamily protein